MCLLVILAWCLLRYCVCRGVGHIKRTQTLEDHYFHPGINIETQAHHDTLLPACITFCVTFSGSTVNPTRDYITGRTALYGMLLYSLTVCPWASILLEHNSKVGPAISSCLRTERGLYRSQLCPAIRLQRGPPCRPAGDRYVEQQGDNGSPAASGFIGLMGKGHYFWGLFSFS